MHNSITEEEIEMMIGRYRTGRKFFMQNRKREETLKRAPIEENFEDFDVSSGGGGNNPAIKEHLEALSSSWCSATT